MIISSNITILISLKIYLFQYPPYKILKYNSLSYIPNIKEIPIKLLLKFKKSSKYQNDPMPKNS